MQTTHHTPCPGERERENKNKKNEPDRRNRHREREREGEGRTRGKCKEVEASLRSFGRYSKQPHAQTCAGVFWREVAMVRTTLKAATVPACEHSFMLWLQCNLSTSESGLCFWDAGFARSSSGILASVSYRVLLLKVSQVQSPAEFKILWLPDPALTLCWVFSAEGPPHRKSFQPSTCKTTHPSIRPRNSQNSSSKQNKLKPLRYMSNLQQYCATRG